MKRIKHKGVFALGLLFFLGAIIWVVRNLTIIGKAQIRSNETKVIAVAASADSQTVVEPKSIAPPKPQGDFGGDFS